MTVLDLYSEEHGHATDRPTLLLIHGGGSTIESNFGALIPHLTASRRVLAVELQGHGRTPSTSRSPSFESSADDVAAVLAARAPGEVDVLGFSNGGNVALRLAMRHPAVVRRLVVASALYRRDGMVDGFWDGMAAATSDTLPAVLREADAAVNPHRPGHAEEMFHTDRRQMLEFTDWGAAELAEVRAPTLVVGADHDVVRPEHTVALAAAIPGARTLIVPGNHGDYLGERLASAGRAGAMDMALPFLLRFLDAP